MEDEEYIVGEPIYYEVLSAFMSIFIWGSGQFFLCKQRLKGILLFAIQLIIIAIEIFTGYWPEYFAGQIEHFNFRLYGGYFTHGIWGLVTLGQYKGAGNDHSTVLMLNGIICCIVIFFILVFYICNIVDAFNQARIYRRTKKKTSSKEYAKQLYREIFPYIFLTPALLMVIFIVIMPIIFSVLTAFTNYNRNHMPPGNLVDWVGIENFKNLLHSPIWSSTFFGVFKWTIIWAVVATTTTYFLGMFQAILLNHPSVRFKSLYRGIMILPWAIPQMISLMVFKNLLNGQFGPVSALLVKIGVTKERVMFLSDPALAKFTIIMVNLWLGFPIFMIMIQGVLSNINNELYEAAAIDGATSWQKFYKITFPLVFRATSPLVVMTFASNFNGFGSVFFLTEGGPANPDYNFAGSTDILISWIYQLTLEHKMYNMAAVMCIMLFILIGGISLWNFKRTSAFKEV